MPQAVSFSAASTATNPANAGMPVTVPAGNGMVIEYLSARGIYIPVPPADPVWLLTIMTGGNSTNHYFFPRSAGDPLPGQKSYYMTERMVLRVDGGSIVRFTMPDFSFNGGSTPSASQDLLLNLQLLDT
jgi:hypothetical protein